MNDQHETMQQDETGRWVPAKPLPTPFGVEWGWRWNVRKVRGDRLALIRSFIDTLRHHGPPPSGQAVAAPKDAT